MRLTCVECVRVRAEWDYWFAQYVWECWWKRRLLFSAELWESRKRLLIFFLGVNSAGKRQFGARWVCVNYCTSSNYRSIKTWWRNCKICQPKVENGNGSVVKCQVRYQVGWICASNDFQNDNADGVVHFLRRGGMYGAKSGASSPVLQFCNTAQSKSQKKLNLSSADICVAPYVWKSWKSRRKRAGSCVITSVVVEFN
jgi:hypothetical protein